MRRLPPFLYAPLLGLLTLPTAASGLTPYPYGSLPSGASASDATNAYTTWKSRYLDTESCGDSVYNSSGGTYSEGMGYGMLMASYLESSDAVLEQLWTFYQANKDNDGLMNWSVSSGSCSNNSANAAADGDLDAACASSTRPGAGPPAPTTGRPRPPAC